MHILSDPHLSSFQIILNSFKSHNSSLSQISDTSSLQGFTSLVSYASKWLRTSSLLTLSLCLCRFLQHGFKAVSAVATLLLMSSLFPPPPLARSCCLSRCPPPALATAILNVIAILGAGIAVVVVAPTPPPLFMWF